MYRQLHWDFPYWPQYTKWQPISGDRYYRFHCTTFTTVLQVTCAVFIVGRQWWERFYPDMVVTSHSFGSVSCLL